MKPDYCFDVTPNKKHCDIYDWNVQEDGIRHFLGSVWFEKSNKIKTYGKKRLPIKKAVSLLVPYKIKKSNH